MLLRLIIIFIFSFSCTRESEDKKFLRAIEDISELNLSEQVIRVVFEIKFPNALGQNRFLIETEGKVRFCVNLSDIKFKVDKNEVIFYNLPKAKVCSYDVSQRIIDYDEDISIGGLLSANNDRNLAFKMAVDSLRSKIERFSDDTLIQKELNYNFKLFLKAFVSNFSKEAKFE